MRINVGYEIEFDSPQPAPMVLMLYLHPSRELTTRKPDRLEVAPHLPAVEYFDLYGNRCGRIVAPTGRVVFRNEALVEDCGLSDLQVPQASQAQVQHLPHEVVLYLLASRYCKVNSELKDLAWSLFGPRYPRKRRCPQE